MKFTCEKTDIVNAVTVASRATNNKTTQTILSCIKVTAEDGKVNICGNNNELAIETNVKADVESYGGIALDAAMFGNIVRNMPDGAINIAVGDDGKAIIKGDRVKFSLQGRSAQEFPDMPKIEKGNAISISQYTLKDIIKQTIFSASINDTNPLMSGVLFEVDGDKLKMVAVDGHRFALRTTALRQIYDNFKVIIPAKNLMEIVKAISGNDVKVCLAGNQVAFDDGFTLIVSRLVAGEFFDVNRMTQQNTLTTVKVKREELMQSLERSTLIAKESEKKPVILTIKDGAIDIFTEAYIGKYNDNIAAEINGSELKIGFNPRFLVDALRAIEAEDITIYFGDRRTPGIIRDDAGEYTYLVLPINFAESDVMEEEERMAA